MTVGLGNGTSIFANITKIGEIGGNDFNEKMKKKEASKSNKKRGDDDDDGDDDDVGNKHNNKYQIVNT